MAKKVGVGKITESGFGILSNVVIDSFVSIITARFEDAIARKEMVGEVPTIEKYEITDTVADGSTVEVNIIQTYPDIKQKMPMIAINSMGSTQRLMGLGSQIVKVTSMKPQIVSSLYEPYSLVNGMSFICTTDSGVHKALFDTTMFKNINAALASEVAAFINLQIPSLNCFAYNDNTGNGNKLVITTENDTDSILIGSGTCNSAIGISSGQSDSSLNYPFQEIIAQAEDMTIVIDCVTGDKNQRKELMDILAAYFGVYIAETNVYQWVSDINAVMNQLDDISLNLPPTYTQIVFNKAFSRQPEGEIAIDGSERDKIYYQSLSVPVLARQYMVRQIPRVNYSAKIIGSSINILQPN